MWQYFWPHAVQNTTPKTKDRATRTPGWTEVLQKGMQFLLHMLHTF